jgi:hypothetical protein
MTNPFFFSISFRGSGTAAQPVVDLLLPVCVRMTAGVLVKMVS